MPSFREAWVNRIQHVPTGWNPTWPCVTMGLLAFCTISSWRENSRETKKPNKEAWKMMFLGKLDDFQVLYISSARWWNLKKMWNTPENKKLERFSPKEMKRKIIWTKPSLSHHQSPPEHLMFLQFLLKDVFRRRQKGLAFCMESLRAFQLWLESWVQQSFRALQHRMMLIQKWSTSNSLIQPLFLQRNIHKNKKMYVYIYI